jgi:hypothetical protein
MTLALSRALFVVVGLGALAMAIGNLASGSSLADPVFPLGLALGAFMVAAGAWTVAPGAARAAAVWLGLLAVAIGIGAFGVMVAGGPNPMDVVAYWAVPSLLVGAAGVRIAIARTGAGLLGA